MKRYTTTILILFIGVLAYSAMPADSLVRFSDLRFHSDFEQYAFVNYLRGNDINLCLAADKNMTEEKAAALRNSYEDMFQLLEKQKLTVKNFRQKFKSVHKIIFNHVPMHYYQNADFSGILDNGDFNYLTAAVLYSLVLKNLNIPSYMLFYLNKTAIIVNPGENQIVLETTAGTTEDAVFNNADSKILIVNLPDKETGYSVMSRSSVVQFNGLEGLKNNQLPATVYFYKAILMLDAGNQNEAYQLIRKACYLCPEEPFVSTMYAMLNTNLKTCKFDRVEDVDMLGQLSKSQANNFDQIRNTFQRIISHRIVEQNDIDFCTAAYERLLPQIKDVLLGDEISFIYYEACAYFKNSDIHNLTPLVEMLKLKPTEKQVLKMIEIGLSNKLSRTVDTKSMLDSLDFYENELANTDAVGLIKKYRLLTYLEMARMSFLRNKPDEGEPYLVRFESTFQPPVPDMEFKIKVENAYYEYARYYSRFNKHEQALKAVKRGLIYVPNSNMIQSGADVIYNSKPLIIHRKMNKAEYDKYVKSGKMK